MTDLRSDLGFQMNSSSLGYVLVMQRKLLPETIETVRAIWSNIDLRADFKDRKLDYLIIKRADGVHGLSTLSEPFDTLYQNSAWRVVSPNVRDCSPFCAGLERQRLLRRP